MKKTKEKARLAKGQPSDRVGAWEVVPPLCFGEAVRTSKVEGRSALQFRDWQEAKLLTVNNKLYMMIVEVLDA